MVFVGDMRACNVVAMADFEKSAFGVPSVFAIIIDVGES